MNIVSSNGASIKVAMQHYVRRIIIPHYMNWWTTVIIPIDQSSTNSAERRNNNETKGVVGREGEREREREREWESEQRKETTRRCRWRPRDGWWPSLSSYRNRVVIPPQSTAARIGLTPASTALITRYCWQDTRIAVILVAAEGDSFKIQQPEQEYIKKEREKCKEIVQISWEESPKESQSNPMLIEFSRN